MLCSTCGKDIPFAGTICPYCKRDKSGDQQTQIIAVILAALGGYVGYSVSVSGAVVGFLIGASLGTIIGMIAQRMHKQPEPPEVRIVDSPASKPAQPTSDEAARLAKIGDLRARGLITESEYQMKRDALLRDL